MEFFIIFLLILLNGIFAMAEMALVSARKFKLENARKKGKPGAATAVELSEKPSKFLSTVQIGITLIGILLGVFSGQKIANNLETYFQQFDSIAPYSHVMAVTIIVIVITYLSIILGELVPKRLGLIYPEEISYALARPMKILSFIASPFVWLLTASNDLILKLLGISKEADAKVSEEEIKSIIKESAEGGEIQEIEQNIVERVFELGDRRVNSLFTHRSEIVFFDTSDSWEHVRQKIHEEKHSAYPVCKNHNIDEILGIVLLKDLFSPEIENKFDITKYLHQPVYINENTYAYKVLELFKKEKMHYGVVVDEYGSIIGMVTMDDMLDALVGEVTEHYQDEYQIIKRDENSWLIDGQYSILEFAKYFNINIDEELKEQFSTVAGLIIYSSDSIPDVGEKFTLKDYEFEIVDKDGQRIDKILMTKKI